MVTKLVVDHYRANEAREDISLYDSMCSIRDRLNQNLEVDHPVVSGEKLTKGPDDARTRFLREKLRDAIATLAVLALFAVGDVYASRCKKGAYAPFSTHRRS